jgi:hypothetical protein
MNPPDIRPTPLFVDGGRRDLPSPVTDPLASLDDLMVVIEALSPTWPARAIFRAEGLWLL